MFDDVIWVTYTSNIPYLHNSIATKINLAGPHWNYDNAITKKTKLSDYLKARKFLLVLDDFVNSSFARRHRWVGLVRFLIKF